MHDGSGEDRAVTEQPGVVFAVDDDRAMYVTLADLDAYRNLAEAFGQVPTVAGPPLDLAVLERLRDALAAAKSDVQPAQGHRLSPAEAEYLGLLQLQGTLRATLPLRLHRTCVACGTKKIINPARPKASGTEKASNVASVISGLATLADDPVSGFVDIMKGMGGAQTTTALCDYCEGFEFELPAVTFCPACKALRTEAVLITCPDCRADFAAAEPARDWVPLARARDSARQADIRQLVAAACGRLSGGVYTEQQGKLLAALTAADEPRCLFRSSRPGDSTRSTVLLATARQLVFARETMAGKATVDSVLWTEVTAVYHFGPSGKDTTLQLDRRDAPSLQFTRLGEIGQNLDGPGTVDVVAIARTAAALAGVTLMGNPAPAAVPAQVAPTSAPPADAAPVQSPPAPNPPVSNPPAPNQAVPNQAVAAVPTGPPRPPAEAPGWYPDPWGQARIRWWDGQAWTSHLNA